MPVFAAARTAAMVTSVAGKGPWSSRGDGDMITAAVMVELIGVVLLRRGLGLILVSWPCSCSWLRPAFARTVATGP